MTWLPTARSLSAAVLTDVDVLDGGVEAGRLRGGHGGAEGIQVDHHHVDCSDAVLRQRIHVGGVVAAGQDAAVHPWVQRLHTPCRPARLTLEHITSPAQSVMQ